MPSKSEPPPPRCCSNCWRMRTRSDGRDGLAYSCLEDPEDRDSDIGELDPAMILAEMRCPFWRMGPGIGRYDLQALETPARLARYEEQITLMEVWNRGH